ncbi:MAG: DUF4012 domain-containing protein [Candidatus Pacebacteria bacterium]|nr:DUF4012 domain-containing protein [Candidatus Paceibacterota bacterium]
MNRFFVVVGIVVFIVMGLLSLKTYIFIRTCVQDGKTFVHHVQNPTIPLTQAEFEYTHYRFSLCKQTFDSYIKVSRQLPWKIPYTAELSEGAKIIQSWLPFLPNILGLYDERHYIVLLQNNTELRPTGGFIGSYLSITTRDGHVQDIHIEDIYTPDGQLKGYVEPPKPIAKFLFQEGGWRLRDANWDPDFPSSAQQIAWFFERGGYPQLDGVGAVTLSTIRELLKETGDVYVPDYDKVVSADTIYSFIQSEVEQDFFPGSSKKKDVLDAIFRSFLRSLERFPREKQVRMFKTILSGFQSRDIQLWMRDLDQQRNVEVFGWDGSVRKRMCLLTSCLSDYLYLVEANVGINKANCCIDRTVDYDVWLNQDKTATASLILRYTNHNPSTPQPPKYYGGGYKNYLRIYTDEKNTVFRASDNLNKEIAVEEEKEKHQGLRVYSSLLTIDGGEQRDITYTFSLGDWVMDAQKNTYQLFIQKQSGVLPSDYTIRLHVPDSVRIVLNESDTNVRRLQDGIEKHMKVAQDTLLTFTTKKE